MRYQTPLNSKNANNCGMFKSRGVEEHQHNPCFGVRSVGEDGKTRGEYEWEDYKSVFAKVKDIASALRRIDLNPVRFNEFIIASPCLSR